MFNPKDWIKRNDKISLHEFKRPVCQLKVLGEDVTRGRKQFQKMAEYAEARPTIKSRSFPLSKESIIP